MVRLSGFSGLGFQAPVGLISILSGLVPLCGYLLSFAKVLPIELVHPTKKLQQVTSEQRLCPGFLG